MELTPFGRNYLHPKAFHHDARDFEVHRHDETNFAIVHFSDRDRPIALHKGTSVEAFRLFKLLLITRRLAS